MNPATITIHHLGTAIVSYGPREGLEGPFRYRTGAILYYDPSNGHYLDPGRDVYLDHDHANYAMGVTDTPPAERDLPFTPTTAELL